jgi:hypothetical protein
VFPDTGLKKKSQLQALVRSSPYEVITKRERFKKGMKLREKIEQLGATGYILLWLLGVPIPVLLLFFLLRGCT